MAPMPPARPARSRMRRCVGDSFSRVATQLPRAAPIWDMGPSLPAEPPLARVMIEVTALIGATMGRIRPLRLWKASIRALVPGPPASRAKRQMRYPLTSPPRAGRRTSTQVRATSAGAPR